MPPCKATFSGRGIGLTPTEEKYVGKFLKRALSLFWLFDWTYYLNGKPVTYELLESSLLSLLETFLSNNMDELACGRFFIIKNTFTNTYPNIRFWLKLDIEEEEWYED